MASRSTLAALAQELTDALDPLILAFESADAFEGFMRVLGWTTTGVIQPVQDLASLVTGARELIADGSIDASQVGVQGRFDAHGVSFDNAMKLSAYYLEGFGWAPSSQKRQ